jgi:putative hydrolase of HD superfamily
MAMAHDVAESRTGDVDYLSRQYVQRHEAAALTDMLQDTSLQAEFTQLLEEYEARESLEAKIVKDADNLDVDMELREQASQGHILPDIWKTKHRDHVAANKLFTNTAKQLYKAITASNPHNWHINAPNNRINGGDWKKQK